MRHTSTGIIRFKKPSTSCCEATCIRQCRSDGGPRFSNQVFSISDDILIPGQNSIEITKEVIGLSESETMGLVKSKILIQSKL